MSTERDLHKAINARFFFLMVRLFVLVPPKSPASERRRIGDYLGKPLGDINRFSKKTGKRIGIKRVLRRVHLIAQKKEKDAGRRGLYGKSMKEAAASVMRKAIGSVGYLRSAVVKGIRIYNRGFRQYQKPKWVPLVKPPGYKPPGKTNEALISMANRYGLPEENVAVHKGTRAAGFQAVHGWNPTASVTLSMGISDNQSSRVAGIYNPAMQRAMDDEASEIENHMTQALLANGRVLEDNGISIQ